MSGPNDGAITTLNTNIQRDTQELTAALGETTEKPLDGITLRAAQTTIFVLKLAWRTGSPGLPPVYELRTGAEPLGAEAPAPLD